MQCHGQCETFVKLLDDCFKIFKGKPRYGNLNTLVFVDSEYFLKNYFKMKSQPSNVRHRNFIPHVNYNFGHQVFKDQTSTTLTAGLNT